MSTTVPNNVKLSSNGISSYQTIKIILEVSLAAAPIIDICHAQQSFLDRFHFAEDTLPLLLGDIIHPANEQRTVVELENAILTGYSFSCSLNLQNSQGDPESCNIMISSGSKCVNRFSKSAFNGQEVQRHFLTTMTIRSCSAVANIAVLGVAPFNNNSNNSSGAIDERTRQMVSERMDANEAINITLPKKALSAKKAVRRKSGASHPPLTTLSTVSSDSTSKATTANSIASGQMDVAYGSASIDSADEMALPHHSRDARFVPLIPSMEEEEPSQTRHVHVLSPITSAMEDSDVEMSAATSTSTGTTTAATASTVSATPTLASLPVLEECACDCNSGNSVMDASALSVLL